MQVQILFDRLNKISIYCLVFLFPIFFLPLTENYIEQSKHLLFIFLVILSLIGYLGKSLASGFLEINLSKPIIISLVVLFLFYLTSSVFSSWSYLSFLGLGYDFYDNFVSFIFFVLFFVLLINSFDRKEVFILIFCFLLSVFLVSILNILQGSNLLNLPFNLAKNGFFNPIGSPNDFALLLSLSLPLFVLLFFRSTGFFKIFFGISIFIIFLNLLLINFKTAWLSLVVASIFLFIFGFSHRKNEIFISKASLIIFLLTVSIFFYFFRNPIFADFNTKPEIQLNFLSEATIMKGVFSESIKNLLFGSGPSTFILDYPKYKPTIINEAKINGVSLWSFRFDRGSSFFLDWAITKGLLGVISLICFFAVILTFLIIKITKEEEDSLFDFKAVFSSLVFSFIFVGFLYPFNFTLLLFLWFILGISLIIFQENKGFKITFSKPSFNFLINFSFVTSVVLSISAFYYYLLFYTASFYYNKGIVYFNEKNFDKAIESVIKSTNFISHSDTFWRDLAKFYVVKANIVSQDKDLAPKDKINTANLSVIEAQKSINKAIEIGPRNVMNWSVRGFFYTNLIGIEGAFQAALNSYDKAIELEPSSPYYYSEKGRLYLLIAQFLSDKGKKDEAKSNIDLAISEIKKSLEKMPSYPMAYYLLAVAYDQKGEIDEAIKNLQQVTIVAPQDFGAIFQLGLLYWRDGMLKEAQIEFEKVLDINKDYNNARYMLGLVYDKLGKKEEAKKEFEKILSSIGGESNNEEIKKILDNLNKGLPALEGLTAEESSLKEVPPEVSF
jgi:tetratricopeptide (TPR) repeat protein